MCSYKVTFSLVVYKQSLEELQRVVASLLLYPALKSIFVIDNSPGDEARELVNMDSCISYQHMSRNLGFGKAHNLAFNMAKKAGSKYHFVVNPDIFYEQDVVTPMVNYMDAHSEIGQMMPKILYPDGRTQFLPKLMPTPKMMAQRKMRKFLPKKHERWMQRFEMRPMKDDRTYDVGVVSGCFSVVRMEAIERCGIYDDRFFMYFEDTDLTRRIHRHFRTVYFPKVSVYHAYGNGASKQTKLFFIFVSSFMKFFCKWGWFFDKERSSCNRSLLKQIDIK